MRLRRMPTGVWLDPLRVCCVYDSGHKDYPEVSVAFVNGTTKHFLAQGSDAAGWVAAMQERSVPR